MWLYLMKTWNFISLWKNFANFKLGFISGSAFVKKAGSGSRLAYTWMWIRNTASTPPPFLQNWLAYYNHTWTQHFHRRTGGGCLLHLCISISVELIHQKDFSGNSKLRPRSVWPLKTRCTRVVLTIPKIMCAIFNNNWQWKKLHRTKS
jgi:hypothetical protein